MPKEAALDKSKPKQQLKRNTSRVDAKEANAFFAKWAPNAVSKSSNTITKPKKPSTVMVSESEDELLLRSPKMRKKEKKKETTRPTYSLEEYQTSSPARSSGSSKNGTGSRGMGGPGPSSSKNAKRPGGVFGGTIGVIPRPPVHDSSAVSRQSSLSTPVPKSSTTPIPKSSTTPAPKSKVNPSRPIDTTKKSGLEAVKQSMRKPPKVEISAAQLQFERDHGSLLEPVLSKEEIKRNEELEAEKVSALEFMRNYKQTVDIDLYVLLSTTHTVYDSADGRCPRPVVVEEKLALGMILDCDDEFAEEELTEEEKEYLKGFCDQGDLCLVCSLPRV
jgi:hypothetical protein